MEDCIAKLCFLFELCSRECAPAFKGCRFACDVIDDGVRKVNLLRQNGSM